MEKVSIFISILFILTTFFVVWQFYKASGKSKAVLYSIILWMLIQSVAGLTGFFQQVHVIPPRFIFLPGPGIVIIIILFLTKKGKSFIDSLDIKELTLLHIVRVPVEITLYFLFLAELIPVFMTFEGYNFDILSGLSAPSIWYLVFVSKKANMKILLFWNFMCLALLINILIIAVLSAQTPFQKLAFDQPNVAVTYFPFVWLPGVIVPLVLFSHLSSIRQLLKAMR